MYQKCKSVTQWKLLLQTVPNYYCNNLRIYLKDGFCARIIFHYKRKYNNLETTTKDTSNNQN